MNRQILVSAIVIGVVGAFATGSTMALFNDVEISDDNVFASGKLDLKIDHHESYNGEYQEESSFNPMNDPNSFFNLQDIKPGDYGNGTVSLHLENNPGYVWVNINGTKDKEVSCTEPEKDAEPNCDPKGEGELDEHIEGKLWYDYDGDGVYDKKEEDIIATGTLSELSDSPMALDANLSDGEQSPYQAGETNHIGFKWKLPKETGNEVQTDSYKFDVWFYTEQARHNSEPDNPFASDNT